MKKPKCALYSLFFATLLVTLLFAFISCEKCEDHTDLNCDGLCDTCDEALPAVTGGVELVKGGKALFNIVIPKNTAADLRMYIQQYLVSDLAMRGSEISVFEDNGKNVTDCEILIGEITTRGDAYRIDPRYLGSDGYAVKVVGTKILILGGSSDATKKAIESFCENVLGFSESAVSLRDVTMHERNGFEVGNSTGSVDHVRISGTDIRNYVILVDFDDKEAKKSAESMQSLLYSSAGIYIRIASSSESAERAVVFESTLKSGAEGFYVTVEGGNLKIKCEFSNKFEEATVSFVRDSILEAKGGVDFAEGYSFVGNVRDIHYADFGAVGDGKTDDFSEIKACHEYANRYGHRVFADPGSPVYYIGHSEQGSSTVKIMTDTNWEGAKFIFDDSNVTVDSGPYYTPIFTIAREHSYQSFSEENIPTSKTLTEGETTNIGWAPGYKALLYIYSDDVRHYIRYGSNENNGSAQQELILVDAEGNIDPSTPLQWSYERVTSVYVYRVDDAPITVTGGEAGCEIETICNQAPSKYTYYRRNILITRSNSTLSGIRHSITNILDHCAPYVGFTTISYATDVTVENMLFQCPVGYKTEGADGNMVGMGTYEISAEGANNVLWRGCRQSNFFRERGRVKFDGMMGTNYCKNLTFDDMFVCSFDAHCGVYNATIMNSTLEHMNFIGEGTIKIRNTTVYTDGTYAGLCFRSDYGSTWDGEIDIDGLELRTSKKAKELKNLTLISAQYTNHDFGYDCYLPKTLRINNVRVVRFGYISLFGKRIEVQKEVNHVPLYVYWHVSGLEYDISDPDATVGKQNDVRKCTCVDDYPKAGLPVTHFNDTDGDGRCNNARIVLRDGVYKQDTSVWCWGTEEEINEYKNVNPISVTKEIYVSNIGDLDLRIPSGPAFSDLKVSVTDSEFIPWYPAEQGELTIYHKKAVDHVDD